MIMKIIIIIMMMMMMIMIIMINYVMVIDLKVRENSAQHHLQLLAAPQHTITPIPH